MIRPLLRLTHWLALTLALTLACAAHAQQIDLAKQVKGALPLANMATIGANTVLGRPSSGVPQALAVPSCSAANNALNWTSGTGFSCATITAGNASTVASGTAALGTSAIGSGVCASVVTVTATGTLTTDVVTASFNGDPTAVTGYIPATTGMLAIIPYPTTNTANFKVCNNTSASITPGALTLNWRVAR